MQQPDLIYGVPDFHSDEWVRTEKKDDGTPRYDVAKHEAERARDGFSTYDWWSFDTYIAEVVARAALKFAKDGVGYFQEMGEEGTTEYFIGIAGPLMRFAQEKFDSPEDYGQMIADAKAAMARFAEHFERWWD